MRKSRTAGNDVLEVADALVIGGRVLRALALSIVAHEGGDEETWIELVLLAEDIDLRERMKEDDGGLEWRSR